MRSRYQPLQVCICLCFFTSLLLFWSTASFASPRVVERVDVGVSATGTEITFSFGVPLQYQSHYPDKNSNELQIDLQAIRVGDDTSELEKRYNLNWNKVADNPLDEITYEGDSTGKVRLLFRFKQAINFELVAGSDPRSLQVKLISSAPPTKTEAPSPAVVEAPSPAVVEAPSPAVTEAALAVQAATDPPMTTPDDPSKRYAINLRSSLTPINVETLPQVETLQQHQSYTATIDKNGKTWYRLRLGFFTDEKTAKELQSTLKKDYPESWVTKSPISDHTLAQTNNLFPNQNLIAAAPVAAAAAIAATAPSAAGVPAQQLPVAQGAVEPTAAVDKPALATDTPDPKAEQLFEAAKGAMVAEDYRRAVQYYTKLTQSTEAAVRQQSQEFLGLARERNGQVAHAKAEYEKYLLLYPEGEGSARVKQRLAGLLTAMATPKQQRRKAKQIAAEDKWQTQVYGSFSQFYDRDVTYTQEDETIINRSALRSDLDFNARVNSEDIEFNTTFIGGIDSDFREDGEDELRISSLYVDAFSFQTKLQARIGRQSRSTGGVLGRFDGALLRWQAHDLVAINLVGGFPVISTRETEIDTDRPMYGISFDWGTFAKSWDFNTYYITQDVEGITDRQAVGGEIRYFAPTISFFSLLDYDINYDDLNTALLTANWRLPTKTSLNVSMDYRNSPVLTTSNALIGQTARSIEELLLSYTQDEIQQLAHDRTATSRSYTLGVTQSVNAKLQISGDITAAKFSSTPASGGVEAQPGTDYEFFYSLQFVGSSLIKTGDIGIIGFRYSDTDRSNTYSASVNTRYPVTRAFRVNPRAIIDLRTNKNDDGEQWKFRPLLRLEYVWKRRFNFEAEGGFEWSSEQLAGRKDDTEGYFLTVGYRINF